MLGKTYTLIHPIAGTTMTATQTGYYMEAGKMAGIEVQFPCGHTVKLTFAEIDELTPETAAVVPG